MTEGILDVGKVITFDIDCQKLRICIETTSGVQRWRVCLAVVRLGTEVEWQW